MTSKPTASISKLTFSSGQSFDLSPSEKIILVGANNSGKSQSLREIISIAHQGEKFRPIVISNMEINKNGTKEDLKQFLETNGDYYNGKYRFKSWQINSEQIAFWSNKYLQHDLLYGYIKNIAANDRLTICNQQNSISPDEQKSKPQHVLYDDQHLMSKVSGLFRKAFGKEIMFDFRGGNKLPIHVGELPASQILDRVSNEYVDLVRQNPLLDQQGDGMKSYAGILLKQSSQT